MFFDERHVLVFSKCPLCQEKELLITQRTHVSESNHKIIMYTWLSYYKQRRQDVDALSITC